MRHLLALILIPALGGFARASAAPPHALGRNDLLFENAHPCRNPLTERAFTDWGRRCNEASKVSFAGAFPCHGHRVEVFSYLHFFQTFAGSGNIRGGQLLGFFVDGRFFRESDGLDPPFHRLRVDARGVGTLQTLDSRGNVVRAETVRFCGPRGLVDRFPVAGDYHFIPDATGNIATAVIDPPPSR